MNTRLRCDINKPDLTVRLELQTQHGQISGAFTLDLDKIEGRGGVERLSEIGPKLVEHDLDDIINSDPVMLPVTRTGLQQRVGRPESGGNRLIQNQEAHQVDHFLYL